MSDEAIDLESYALVDDCTGQEVMRFDTPRAAGLWAGCNACIGSTSPPAIGPVPIG